MVMILAPFQKKEILKVSDHLVEKIQHESTTLKDDLFYLLVWLFLFLLSLLSYSKALNFAWACN